MGPGLEGGGRLQRRQTPVGRWDSNRHLNEGRRTGWTSGPCKEEVETRREAERSAGGRLGEAGRWPGSGPALPLLCGLGRSLPRAPPCHPPQQQEGRGEEIRKQALGTNKGSQAPPGSRHRLAPGTAWLPAPRASSALGTKHRALQALLGRRPSFRSPSSWWRPALSPRAGQQVTGILLTHRHPG